MNEPIVEILNEVRIDYLTGQKYDAIIKTKCTCDCHKKGVIMMHIMACCKNGYIEVYRYIT